MLHWGSRGTETLPGLAPLGRQPPISSVGQSLYLRSQFLWLQPPRLQLPRPQILCGHICRPERNNPCHPVHLPCRALFQVPRRSTASPTVLSHVKCPEPNQGLCVALRPSRGRCPLHSGTQPVLQFLQGTARYPRCNAQSGCTQTHIRLGPHRSRCSLWPKLLARDLPTLKQSQIENAPPQCEYRIASHAHNQHRAN